MLVLFGVQVSIAQPFTNDADTLSQKISDIKKAAAGLGGGTSLFSATTQGIAELAKVGASDDARSIIVVTDGKDTATPAKYTDQVIAGVTKSRIAAKVDAYTVGIQNVDMTAEAVSNLKALASTSGDFHLAQSLDDLQNQFANVALAVKKRSSGGYKVTICTPRASLPGIPDATGDMSIRVNYVQPGEERWRT